MKGPAVCLFIGVPKATPHGFLVTRIGGVIATAGLRSILLGEFTEPESVFINLAGTLGIMVASVVNEEVSKGPNLGTGLFSAWFSLQPVPSTFSSGKVCKIGK